MLILATIVVTGLTEHLHSFGRFWCDRPAVIALFAGSETDVLSSSVSGVIAVTGGLQVEFETSDHPPRDGLERLAAQSPQLCFQATCREADTDRVHEFKFSDGQLQSLSLRFEVPDVSGQPQRPSLGSL